MKTCVFSKIIIIIIIIIITLILNFNCSLRFVFIGDRGWRLG
ncbi:MAG: hypothetical protein N7Q72_02460 [Spiroplasma sp. Tabriz.8]|nr:hypothetical protein [Candidatus Regiella insecticola]MCZ8632108.1 hypothetical protein [Spiroplasma sp. Tabriz.8]